MNDLQAQLQNAQDMLTAVLNQRNASQNECVQLAAQVQAANRKISELEAKLKELEAVPADPNVVPQKSNGHDDSEVAMIQ